MKKRVYFVISSILQILVSIVTAITAKEIVEELIVTFESMSGIYPEAMLERMVNMYQNNGILFVVLESFIVIILNAYILYKALKGNVLKVKGKLIVLSLASCFFGINIIVSILSIINVIVLAVSKRKNEDDYPEKKKGIPALEYPTSTKKEKILSIVFVIAYFSQFLINTENMSFNTSLIITIVLYVILFALAIIIFKNLLKKDLKVFNENKKEYFSFVVPKLFIMYVVVIIVNTIASGITRKCCVFKSVNTREHAKMVYCNIFSFVGTTCRRISF
jgi:hypothetical protein